MLPTTGSTIAAASSCHALAEWPSEAAVRLEQTLATHRAAAIPTDVRGLAMPAAPRGGGARSGPHPPSAMARANSSTRPAPSSGQPAIR